MGNLHDIGLAIRDFQSDHGVYPPELSSLVPQYITATNLQLFYVTNDSYRALELPTDWNVNPGRIERYSSYVYLGTNNPNGIIAYEKTNLWKPTVARPDQVAVLYSDGHVISDLPISKLAGLIATNR